MSEPKISVVIPLYNAEKFVRQTLISVLASKFKDYEVLVVDDCSTDSSVAEVEKMLPHFDGRLKILSTQTNSGGAGVPRNIGINHASGKYLTFVDNDDMLLPTALGDFFNVAEKFHADVVHTVKAFVYEDADVKPFSRADLQLQSDSSDNGSKKPRLETKDLRKRMTDYVAEKYFWLPWGKFYRRAFLLENEIDFPQIRYSEDMVFCFKCLCLAKKYLRVSFVTNIHRVRQKSASKNVCTPHEGTEDWLRVLTVAVQSIEEFTGRLEFFKANPDVRREVLKFFVDKHFSFQRNAFRNLPICEVEEIFRNELQNPELNPTGKNLVDAYLYAEKFLT